jgi:hypothetical protein
MTEVDLEGASLPRANLERARLNGGNLRGADLSGANLRGADLWEAYLTGCNLKDADLRGADLIQAVLEEAIPMARRSVRCALSAARLRGDAPRADEPLGSDWADLGARRARVHGRAHRVAQLPCAGRGANVGCDVAGAREQRHRAQARGSAQQQGRSASG